MARLPGLLSSLLFSSLLSSSLIFLLLPWQTNSSGPDASCYETFRCTKDQCQGKCTTDCQPDGSDGSPCEGIKMNFFDNDSDFCDCCPQTCVPYLKEGEKCVQQAQQGSISYGLCGPGLTCGKDQGASQATCRRKLDTVCLQQLGEYEAALESGELGIEQYPPVCDEEGMFRPKQCRTSDICRCVARDTGEPIFGLETDVTAAQDMTCACATQVHELRAQGCAMRVSYEGKSEKSRQRFDAEYSACLEAPEHYFPRHLRCQPNGNFDTAQCIEQTPMDEYYPGYLEEQCFCYYEGQPFNSSLVPIRQASVVLDCHKYNATWQLGGTPGDGHFAGYYRPCERRHVELRLLKEACAAEGREYISTEQLPVCGPDGYYAEVQPVQGQQERGYCSDLMGNRLEDFSGSPYTGALADMDCQCALTRNRTDGWGEKPSCTSSGSYTLRQCRGGKCYCADKWGHQCSKEMDESVQGCCLSDCCLDTAEETPAFDKCRNTCHMDVVPFTTTTTTTTTTAGPTTTGSGPTGPTAGPCTADCVNCEDGKYGESCCGNTFKCKDRAPDPDWSGCGTGFFCDSENPCYDEEYCAEDCC